MIPQIDPTERKLILKFFGVNTIPNNLKLGVSNFKNIIDFYMFEYKDREAEFWGIVYPKALEYPDIMLPIEMTRVSYNWADYVTVVDVSYKIRDNQLIMNTLPNGTKHNKMLQLICCMIFVSDFNQMDKHKQGVDTSKAWRRIMELANEQP